MIVRYASANAGAGVAGLRVVFGYGDGNGDQSKQRDARFSLIAVHPKWKVTCRRSYMCHV